MVSEERDNSYHRMAENYTVKRKTMWESISNKRSKNIFSKYYHERLLKVYSHNIPKNKRVLEVGCGEGDLLAHMEPSYGVGIDFSDTQIESASKKHPHISFRVLDAHSFSLNEKFDYIILSDLLNDLLDVQKFFKQLKLHTTDETRIVINLYSRVWELPLALAKAMGLANPLLKQNWLTVADVRGLLELNEYEIVKNWTEILLPVKFPIVSGVFNKVLAKTWPFNLLALTNFINARPLNTPKEKENVLVSIIIAARNEEGNVKEIFNRTDNLDFNTELIFVEGGSTDNTYKEVEKHIEENPQRNCKLFRQTGVGKGDAVRLGFEKAQGEVLMILDADLTVPPEMLERFYVALLSGKGEFVNGVRLVYPMEDEAMRFSIIWGTSFLVWLSHGCLGNQ